MDAEPDLDRALRARPQDENPYTNLNIFFPKVNTEFILHISQILGLLAPFAIVQIWPIFSKRRGARKIFDFALFLQKALKVLRAIF